jgi:geranylgeranylglycerol-phosphate geranylgeranyltransferase
VARKNIILTQSVRAAKEGAGRTLSAAGYVKLLRLGNCAMGALGALLAAIISVGLEGLEDYAIEVAVSMATVVCFTAGGNSYNDYFDRDVDKVAHPERPIPSGTVDPQSALLLSLILFALSLSLSFFIGLLPVAIVITSLLVMVLYERFLKAEGLAGNLSISWLTGALFLLGGAAVESIELAWILAALAFLATLGREIAKDIQDIEGDRGSRRTLPMRIGPRRAGVAASASFVSAVVLSPLPYVLDLLSLWYIPVVLAADAIFIYCALILFRNPERGQKIAKLAMMVSLIAFLIGGLT